MRWLKWLGGIVGALALLVGVVFAWGALEYSDHPLIPHKRVTITLPFGAETEATGIRAMGEVEQYHPFGHPGIDFQWEHSVPLIAVADGTITSISRAEDMGEPVWYVTLQTGAYNASYKELDTYAPGLRNGSKLKQGDLVGTPHCTYFADGGGHDHCQVHWEWAYTSFVPMVTGKVDRLCPLTYFDAAARTRVDAIWASDPVQQAVLPGFPDLCSGQYAGKDQ